MCYCWPDATAVSIAEGFSIVVSPLKGSHCSMVKNYSCAGPKQLFIVDFVLSSPFHCDPLSHKLKCRVTTMEDITQKGNIKKQTDKLTSLKLSS